MRLILLSLCLGAALGSNAGFRANEVLEELAISSASTFSDIRRDYQKFKKQADTLVQDLSRFIKECLDDYERVPKSWNLIACASAIPLLLATRDRWGYGLRPPPSAILDAKDEMTSIISKSDYGDFITNSIARFWSLDKSHGELIDRNRATRTNISRALTDVKRAVEQRLRPQEQDDVEELYSKAAGMIRLDWFFTPVLGEEFATSIEQQIKLLISGREAIVPISPSITRLDYLSQMQQFYIENADLSAIVEGIIIYFAEFKGGIDIVRRAITSSKDMYDASIGISASHLYIREKLAKLPGSFVDTIFLRHLDKSIRNLMVALAGDSITDKISNISEALKNMDDRRAAAFVDPQVSAFVRLLKMSLVDIRERALLLGAFQSLIDTKVNYCKFLLERLEMILSNRASAGLSNPVSVTNAIKILKTHIDTDFTHVDLDALKGTLGP